MFSPLDYTPEELFDANDEIGFDSERFVVGDTVYIHPDLRETEKGASVTEQMVSYAGSLARVVRVLGGSYKLDVDDSDFVWDDYLLLTSDEYMTYKYGLIKGLSEEKLEDLI